MSSISQVNILSTEISYTIAKPDILEAGYKTLSPLIFTKAKPIKKSSISECFTLYIFENLLSIIVQAYYKSDYQLNAICNVLIKDEKSNQKSNEKKSTEFRNKAIKKTKLNKVQKKQKNSKEKEDETTNSSFIDENNILDYLISPLKSDAEFG